MKPLLGSSWGVLRAAKFSAETSSPIVARLIQKVLKPDRTSTFRSRSFAYCATAVGRWNFRVDDNRRVLMPEDGERHPLLDVRFDTYAGNHASAPSE